MKEFEFYSPTHIFFGPNRVNQVAEHFTKIAKKPLIVIGQGSAKKSGLLENVISQLRTKNITPVIFEGIEPNPRHTTVNQASKLGAKEKVDSIIALGGGSVIDASKFIASVVTQPQVDSWDLTLGQSKFNMLKDPLPILAIPTTAATASEVTPYAVLSNTDENAKSIIASDLVKPKIAILDPKLTFTVNSIQTADHSCDILSHVFENYLLGGNDSIIADRYSEALIKTVFESTLIAIDNPEDYIARSNLQWSATLALNGLQMAGRNPSEFPLHSIEHACSGFYPSLAHGRGLACLFIPYMKYLQKNNRAIDRMARLEQEIGQTSFKSQQEGATLWIERLQNWLKKINSFQTLESVGVSPTKFHNIAQYAVSIYGQDNKLNALGEVGIDDIVAMLGYNLF